MRRITLAFLALFVVGIALSGTLVSAWRGEFGNEAVRDAIEENDFSAWRTAMIEDLTEDRFNQMAEMHKNRPMPPEMHEEVEAAIEAGDYDAWKAAMDSLEVQPRIAEVIDEDNFDLLVEMHTAREEGDIEKLTRLKEELGLKGPGFGGPKGGRGMHRGEGSDMRYGRGLGECGAE